MKIGVISDVHANLEALREVERSLRALKVDRIVSLGDVVGYGASPDECCDVVRRIADVNVLGNHDAAVSGRMDYGFYYDAARHALDWTAARMRPENLEWLRGIPYAHRDGNIGYCHGSPVNPEAYEYILAREQAEDLLPHLAELPEVTFIGHSHLCKVFGLPEAGEVTEVTSRKFALRPGLRYIVTVGAVGQPRDYDNRACFVVHDTDARTVEFVRVAYDIEASAKKIFAADVALNFGRRLFLGV